MQEMSDIQLEADDVTEILNTYCRLEAVGRDGMSLCVFPGDFCLAKRVKMTEVCLAKSLFLSVSRK